MNVMEMRVFGGEIELHCSKCGKLLPLSEFGAWVDYRCRDCRNESNRESKRRRHELRDASDSKSL